MVFEVCLAYFYFSFFILSQSQMKKAPVSAMRLWPMIIFISTISKKQEYNKCMINERLNKLKFQIQPNWFENIDDQTVILQQYQINNKMGNCSSDPNPQNTSQLAVQQSTRKRFNPFFQPNAQNSEQRAILSQFNFHSNYDDKFLGRCSILQHKQSKNFYLSKQIQTSSEQEYTRKLREFLQIQQKLNFQNIIQIKHIIQKQSDGFFVQRKKLIVIVDYPLTNLQKQYNSRLINKLEFNRQQIINILISCIKGYALIERQKSQDYQIFRNDKIRLKNLFFGIKNRQTLIKVAESSLLTEKTNLQCILKDAYNAPENRDIYLAPEQFKAYLRDQNTNRFEKAGVFSFGMSVLDLCLMNSSRQVYHYDQKIVDFNEIRNRILIAGKTYGAIVEKFLGDMLELDENKRPSFNQLESKIPSLLVSRNAGEASKMNLSVARSNSVYLRNNPRNIRQSMSRSRESVRSRSNSRGSLNKGNISSNYSSMSINSRYTSKIGRRMRGQNQDADELDRVHQIYDKNIGREYIGQKKGAFKHGQGRYQFQKNGSFYEGQWRNNRIQGKGQSFFRQGQLEYSGEWKSDQYHGWGTLYTNPAIDTKWYSFEGEFKNGVKQGRGQMKFRNGVIYDGEFRGDKIHGRGKIIREGKILKDQHWQLVNPQTFLKLNALD